ncbi:MAG: hypothetical protein U1F68_13355 [Gammaproteobacteria bacterium]
MSLRAAIRERLAREQVHGRVRSPPSAGRLRAKLFSLQAVKTESSNAAGEWLIEVEAPRKPSINYAIRKVCEPIGCSPSA